MPPTLVPSRTDATTERLEPAARPAAGRYLAVKAGAEQRFVRLEHGATHIGRSWAAEIAIEDQAVSRRHAILYATAESVRILDDRSANGTRVNRRFVSVAELADGDVIEVGRAVLIYREID